MDVAMPIPGQAQDSPAAADNLSEAERTWGIFVHLSTILSLTVIPVVPGVVMWLIKRKESHYLHDTTTEVLNFQITLILYFIACGFLMVVLIGLPLTLGVLALGVFGIIKGTIAGSRGHYFRYPMCIRMIRSS